MQPCDAKKIINREKCAKITDFITKLSRGKCDHKQEKTCVSVLMLTIPRQEAVIFEVPPLIIGCQGDVSAGAKNIHHMCWLRNVCVLTGMPRLWKTHMVMP